MKKNYDNNVFGENDKKIFKAFSQSPGIYGASKFWHGISKKQKQELIDFGYENIKQTVHREYFYHAYSAIRSPYTLYLFSNTPKKDLWKILWKNKRITNCPFPFFRRNLYKYHLGMLYEFVKKQDKLGILDTLSEPETGNPSVFHYCGKSVSQEMLNSTLEFYAIEEGMKVLENNSLAVAEIGAGYGRLAFIFLSLLTNKNIKYCVFDIPVALNVSQYYLTNVFPHLKSFTFRDFKNFDDVKKEFEEAQICFFLPHQFELLPDDTFDLVTTIATLPEMRGEQVDNYIKQINRKCKGYFYNKQTWKNYNKKDNYWMTFTDYDTPSNWRPILLRPASYMQNFFEVLYRIYPEN